MIAVEQQPASPPGPASPAPSASPTLWGYTPVQLHERYWAAHGVQVIPVGSRVEVNPHAELYLLTERNRLVIMPLRRSLDLLCWLKPDLLMVRLADRAVADYREQVESRPDGRFLRFRRIYDSSSRLARVALTGDVELARDWAHLAEDSWPWRSLRRRVPVDLRAAVREDGRIYGSDLDRDSARFVRDLAEIWSRPDATVGRVRRVGREGWADRESGGSDGAGITGPIWIGAGRSIPPDTLAVGPAVLWDDPDARPVPEDLSWKDIEAKPAWSERRIDEAAPYTGSALKRGFDVVFALAALALTLPLYPLIMLAIWVEDRRPFFFAHERESINGREFGCLKFRTMFRNAEEMKARLAQENKADGPQFYIENDPRITRVGRVLRKLQLDEIPQFLNVLAGHMSVVGPRPSPYSENQYCPGWREARLSVRPGVTGLWQIRRTRADGADFQEWIRYDIEYVEKASFWLDLYIVWKTVLLVFGALTRK
jgi:lipopolysaccharide/colanic/teichoic acid biosynthesis glycosyltransferase